MNWVTFIENFNTNNRTPIINLINYKWMPVWYIGIDSIVVDPDHPDWVLVVMKNNWVHNIFRKDLKELFVTLIIDNIIQPWQAVVTESLNDKSSRYRQWSWQIFRKFNWKKTGIFQSYWFTWISVYKNILIQSWNTIWRVTNNDILEQTSYAFTPVAMDSKAFIDWLKKWDEDYEDMLDNIFNKVKKLGFVEDVVLGETLNIYINPKVCRWRSLNWKQYWFAIPPMAIVLDYRSWSYRVDIQSWIHPHVWAKLCTWNYASTLSNSWKDVELCVVMLYELLTTFNSWSPFFRPVAQDRRKCVNQTNKYNKEIWTKHEFEKMYYEDEKPISESELRSIDPSNVLWFFNNENITIL